MKPNKTQSRSSRFQNHASYRTPELIIYLNELWDLNDEELQEFLKEDFKNFLRLLSRILNVDEILNTIFILLRISKIDMGCKMKCYFFAKVLSAFENTLSIFIIHLPLLQETELRDTEFRENPERFWFSLFELIKEIITLDDQTHKKYIMNIFFSCKNFIANRENLKQFKMPEIPDYLLGHLNKYLNLSCHIKTLKTCPSYEDIIDSHENVVVLKTMEDYQDSKEYFLNQYCFHKNKFNTSLLRAIKQLHEDIKTDNINNNVEFRVFTGCTFHKLQNEKFLVKPGCLKNKFFEEDEFKAGSLFCFSNDNYETYFFVELSYCEEKTNKLFVTVLNHIPNLLDNSFTMAEYKVEFYRAFESLLTALQLSFFQKLPMEQYIMFKETKRISPPQYLLTNSKYSFKQFQFQPLCTDDWPSKEIFNLDADQYATLQYILTHELALLKGCPGTGKTRVVVKAVEILLKNEELWRVNDGGPIIILAYTNRSLDNFLEKLIPLTNSIIRFGKQIVNESLKTFTFEQKRSPHSNAIFKKYKTVENKIMQIMAIIETVMKNSGVIHADKLGISELSDSDLYRALIGKEDEKHRKTLIEEFEDLESTKETEVKRSNSLIYYQRVDSLNKVGDADEQYLMWRLTHKNAHQQFYPDENNKSASLKNLTGNKLWGFYFYLVDKWVEQLKFQIKLLEEQLEFLKKSSYEQTLVYNVSSIKHHKIIGLTFSGAQFRKALLDNLNSSIVIIEETSEIEHYNILSTIPNSCKHLILIGDDKPNIIRPSEKNNDYSLIDILSHHNYPGRVLRRQYRMRPEISFIIKNLFYPDLTDDPSVEGIPDIPGMPKKMFFIKHNIEIDESERRKLKRCVCLYELEFLAQFAKFLVSKGVKPESITIQTHTKYQAKEFDKMKECDQSLQGICSWSIDHLQSLENDIILLSLIGIDESFYQGFIDMKNRMGIAFSRAKHGLYVIGNIEKFCKNDPTNWLPIKKLLEENECIGNGLPISCDSHKGKNCAFVENPNDFLNINDQLVMCRF